jgi:hypothetical protein
MMKYTVDKNGIVNILNNTITSTRVVKIDEDAIEDAITDLDRRYDRLVREYRNLGTAKMRRKEIIDILVDLEDQIEELKINLSL